MVFLGTQTASLSRFLLISLNTHVGLEDKEEKGLETTTREWTKNSMIARKRDEDNKEVYDNSKVPLGF